MERLRTRPMLIGIAIAAVLLGAGAYLVFGGRGSGAAAVASASPTLAATPSLTASPSPSASPTTSASPSPTPVAARCPLNGLPMADASAAARTPLIVQIENHPAARPARNLNSADIVFEATVEGDTTRFSAVFLCQPTIGLTGPVRSARYYNIDLWQDLHLLTVGFGASNPALDRFAAAGMPYVNGLSGGWPWYQRVSGRAAPHNLYADLERVRSSFGKLASLDALASRVGTLRPPFTFEEGVTPAGGHTVHSLTIKTNSYWRFGWTWDAASSAWQRQDAGVAIEDAASGEPVSATSILVQRVTEEVVYGDPDPGGNPRRLQHLVGTGAGTLYVDGQAVAVKWSRASKSDGTVWTYAASGDRVVLPPGRIWWEIVPVQGSVTEG
jgi:hypothetical protein